MSLLHIPCYSTLPLTKALFLIILIFFCHIKYSNLFKQFNIYLSILLKLLQNESSHHLMGKMEYFLSFFLFTLCRPSLTAIISPICWRMAIIRFVESGSPLIGYQLWSTTLNKNLFKNFHLEFDVLNVLCFCDIFLFSYLSCLIALGPN